MSSFRVILLVDTYLVDPKRSLLNAWRVPEIEESVFQILRERDIPKVVLVSIRDFDAEFLLRVAPGVG